MPQSRVLTDLTWADVAVDLRIDRRDPLPTRPFAGRRKVTLDGPVVSGTRRDTEGGSPVGIIKWTDPTGFTGAVITMLGAGGEKYHMDTLLPHVAHLVSDHPGSKHKNVTVPRDRGDARFVASMPNLREVLTEGLLTEPIPGVVDSREAMAHRLAWAAVGISDLPTVPFVLRDWDRVPTTPRDDRRNPNLWPEDLTLRGANLVGAWQRAGFNSTQTVGQWVERLYPGLDQAISETSSRRTAIEDLATWEAARFTPEDTPAWFAAARYDTNGFTPRFVPAAFCARLRSQGVTPDHLSYLTSGIDDRAPQSGAVQHVKTWLNVAPGDPTRACWYIAAGIAKDEARRMERSADRPTLEQLRLMAALLTPGGHANLPDID